MGKHAPQPLLGLVVQGNDAWLAGARLPSCSWKIISPPGSRHRANARNALTGSAWYISTRRPTMASNNPRGAGNAHSSAATNSGSAAPLRLSRWRATSRAPAARSIPTTAPSSPTRPASSQLTSPLPQPTSSTRIPGPMPASTSRRVVKSAFASAMPCSFARRPVCRAKGHAHKTGLCYSHPPP